MKHLHFNNHLNSKQSLESFAKEVFAAIVNNPKGTFTISVDDGDGDIWKYEINVSSDRVPEVHQIMEN